MISFRDIVLAAGKVHSPEGRYERRRLARPQALECGHLGRSRMWLRVDHPGSHVRSGAPKRMCDLCMEYFIHWYHILGRDDTPVILALLRLAHDDDWHYRARRGQSC